MRLLRKSFIGVFVPIGIILMIFAIYALNKAFYVYSSYSFDHRVWNERKALPASATHIQDLRFGTLDYPDYLLKARMTEEEFEPYRQKLGYILLPEDKKQYLHWQFTISSHDIRGWWDPSESSEGTYYHPDVDISREKGAVMKYEKGYVYFHYWCGY